MFILENTNARLTPGTWKKQPIGSVHVMCTNGHISYIGHHTIDDDGAVTPSLVCPHEDAGKPCSFHEFVKLDGWAA